MENKFVSDMQARTYNLDHHGLVAAFWQKLQVGQLLSDRLDDHDPRRKIKVSEAICAMVLNGLGFINRPLYLTPRFLVDKPVDRLIAEGLTADLFDDHVLGKALDAIANYGPTQLFAQISTAIAVKSGLLGSSVHLDTTSISFEGDYENCDNHPDGIQVNHGYSKDLRPDLKQIIIGLCTTGPANIPIWTETHNGNASDKKVLPEMVNRIKAFQEQLKLAPEVIWVADSALYSKDGILSSPNTPFITRVPNTISEAARIIELSNDQIDWIPLQDGYQAAEFESQYSGVKQRYILYFSEQAYQREAKTAERGLEKKSQELKKILWHQENKIFGCEKDAHQAMSLLQKQYPLFNIHYRCVAIIGQQKAGRPKEDAQSVIKGYQMQCSSTVNQTAYEEKLQQKGRFILATNQLDAKKHTPRSVLEEYKSQQGVERGFRFLKDPWFMADTLFLKSPRRISALMMIMTLCLLIYNVGQYQLRETLKNINETVPNQKDKPIQNPTLRWIFQIFEGVSIAVISIGTNVVKTVTTNLTDERTKILQFLGKEALEIYGFT